jgi:hypothetical protein
MANGKELESIVQRMIEAGESEENIATVIKAYSPEVKKKDFSGQDSEIPSEPLQENGNKDSVPLVERVGKPSPIMMTPPADYQEEKTIDIMKDLWKRQQETPAYIPQPGDVPSIEEGVNISVTDVLASPVENPELKELYKKGAATLTNARKSFKKHYIEENPEIVEKLNSDDQEVVDSAHMEIYKEFSKKPKILSGTAAEEVALREGSFVDDPVSNIEKWYYSFKAGMKERDFNIGIAQELSSATDEEAKQILELEYERAISESEDISMPEAGLMSGEGVSKMVGTQAVPMATTMTLGVIPGMQPAAVMYSSADAAATSYGAGFRSAYIQGRSQGMSEDESYEIAKKQAKVEGATGAVEGAVGAFTGGLATKAGGSVASRFGSKAIAPLINKAATGVTDMGIDAGVAGVGQIINNWQAKSEGLEVGLFDGVTDEMLGEIIFSTGVKVPNTVTTVAEYKKYTNSLPPKEQQEMFDKIIDSKEVIDQNIAKEKTQKYIDLKAKEAEAKEDSGLAREIKTNPKGYLEKEKKRLETISGSLKNEAARKEIDQNVKALDVMIANTSEYAIKVGDEETQVTKDELVKMIDDPKFIESVAQGETDLTIVNDDVLAEKMQTKVESIVSKEDVDTETKEETKEVSPEEVKPEKVTLYRGTKEKGKEGVVETAEKEYDNVLVVENDQLSHLEELAKEGDERAAEILKSENKWMDADSYMDDLYGDKYDAIKYEQKHTKKPVEYFDTKEKKFYSVDEKYAKIAGATVDRSLKYKQEPTLKTPKKTPKGKAVQKAIDKETGVSKPTTWIKMTEKSALKNKIKTLARGYREGTSIAKKNVKKVQSELLKHIDESFKDLDMSKAVEKQARYMVRNVNESNLETLIDRIDKKVEKAVESDRKKAVKEVTKLVTDKRSVLKKKGSKWVGKVPIETQEFIKNFNLTSLEGMTNKEVREVKESIEAILKTGAKETKALERVRHAQKRVDKAESFEAVYDGEVESISTDKKGLSEVLSDPNKIALIDNQLIESKTALDEYLKDNPEADLSDVKTFTRKSKQIAKFNEERGRRSILSDIARFFDPTRRKANLKNHLSHFAKAGKKGRLLGDKIYKSVVDAENNRNKAVYEKKQSYAKKVKELFGRKVSGYRRLSANADIQPHGEMTAQPSNGQVVHWYNMYQTVDGKNKIDSDGKFDMDQVNKYMNDPVNKDLKAYADYLLNDFYVGLKSEYEPTYTHITGTKFPEGTYYPMFSTSIDGDVHDVSNIMDSKGDVNYKSAVAGNLKQRVKHNNPIDYTRDAHEVALNYISTMERAKNFIPVGELVNSTFNKSSTPEIINLIGSSDMIDLTDHLTAVISGESPRKQSVKDSKFINTVQGIRVFGALAFKLSSIPKQLTSAGRFTTAQDISLKEWFKGFAPINASELKVMQKIASSPYVKERFKGESIDIEANRLLKQKRGSKAAGFLSKATRAGMVSTSIGDIGGVLSGGSPYALAIYRKGIKDGLSKEEAYNKAYKRFIEVSEETQQSTAIHETSHMQRDNIGRLFSSFTTSQTQGINKLVNSTRMLMSKSDLTSDEKKHHAYNIAYYSGENMFFAIVASGFLKELLTSDFSDEDDVESLKKGTYDTVMDNMSSLLSGLDYWGYIANFAINHARGDDWKNELPVIQEVQRLAYGASSLAVYLSSGGDWDSMSDKEKKEIEKMIPADAIFKQFRDWSKYREGDKDFIDALMGYKNDQEKKDFKKVDKIYEGVFGEPYKKGGGKDRRSRSQRSDRRTSR